MIEPVRRDVHVSAPPAVAFRRFTAELDTWWPRATHSVTNERCVSVHMEAAAGGRLVERDTDGIEHEWGRVLTWAPPTEVSFTWHPGMEPSDRQVVRVRFTAQDEGTHVRLEHAGWEVYGEKALETRSHYAEGWSGVLAHFVESLDAATVRAPGPP